MFDEKRILFLYVETPLHAGAGKGLGAVDLPLQRERGSGYPMVQASGVKGCLRSVFRDHHFNGDDSHPDLLALFGKAGDNDNSNYAGAFAPGDARLLLFPVRSLAGVVGWTTSAHALETFRRTAQLAGLNLTNWPAIIPEPKKTNEDSFAHVSRNTVLTAGTQIVLEEFSFAPQIAANDQDDFVAIIGKWLANNALPPSYGQYWKDNLPRRLCILPENAFRDFTQYATEIQTHIKLNPNTKTVDAEAGALWTVESLPIDALLYTPVMATKSRNGTVKPAKDVISNLNTLITQTAPRFQMGGDETTGQGWVAAKLTQ